MSRARRRTSAAKLLALLAALLSCSALAPAHAESPQTPATERAWTRVRTNRFLVIGDAPASAVERVAAHLETVRAALEALSLASRGTSRAQTTVIVFRDAASYESFKPLHRDRPAADVAGYFQAGDDDADYITLHAGYADADSVLRVAAHEYAHQVIRDEHPRAPLWFREGIADYYGTLRVVTPDRVRFGEAIEHRRALLRRTILLPLDSLFEIDAYAPDYTEPERRPLFYAESWALVHLLMSDPARQAQLARYLDLLDAGAARRDALRRAFGTNAAALEAELRGYVARDRFRPRTLRLDAPLAVARLPAGEPLAEAEAARHLGELLLRLDRLDEAEPYLRRAVELDPSLAAAQSALGSLLLRENRTDEALAHLERGVALAPDDWRARYSYAVALRRDTSDADRTLAGYDERTRLLREQLREAIRYAPDFIAAYRLLAEIELERGADTDAALKLIDEALRRASRASGRDGASGDELPRRSGEQTDELRLLLARVRLAVGDYAATRDALTTLTGEGTSPAVRDAADRLSEEATRREAEAAKRAAGDDTLPASARQPDVQPCDLPFAAPHRKPLRFVGRQACGRLVEIDCDRPDGSVLLVVEGRERTLRLHAPRLNRIRFVAYTIESRARTVCGAQRPSLPVLVTYRAAPAVGSEDAADGEAIAVEFVPPEWSHRSSETPTEP